MIIYISGKINGDDSYKAKFEAAERKIRSEYPEAIIYNPAELSRHLKEIMPNAAEIDFLLYDLEHLRNADIVYFMRDWVNSLGCAVELAMVNFISQRREVPILIKLF